MGRVDTFSALHFPIYVQDMSLYLIFLNFFHSIFIASSIQILYMFWWIYITYFICFEVIINDVMWKDFFFLILTHQMPPLFIYLFIFIFIFMAVLGLRFCARAFSSCGKWGPLFIAVRMPLIIVASLVAEHRLQMRRLSNCGSRAQLLCGM